MTQLARDVLPFRKVVSTSCVSQLRVNMPSADLLFLLRERLLDIVSGSDRAQTLNHSPDPSLRSGLRLRTSQITAPNADSMDGDPAPNSLSFCIEFYQVS